MRRGKQPDAGAQVVRRRSPLLTEEDGVAAPKYVYMRRVHERDGRPYCVIDIYLVTARQVLTISTADLAGARHLGIGVNAPVADVRRVFTGPKRRVIYLGEVTYRGDFVHVEFDLKA